MKIIVLVYGLPGAGKTTISDMIAANLGAARINADYVRDHITGHDFSEEGRVKQAQTMAYLSNLMLTGKNQVVVTDFVNPTTETRAAFDDAAQYPVYRILMNTIKGSRYQDTNDLWVEADRGDFILSTWSTAKELNHYADLTSDRVRQILSGGLKRYNIRFNTDVNKDPTIPLKWRVIDCSQATYTEKLASSFHISGSQVWSAQSVDVHGNPKWNVEIEAALYWEGTHANFVAL